MEKIGHNRLKELARIIRFGTKKRDDGRAEWINGTIEVALATAEARQKFKNDAEFGEWWVDADLDADYNEKDRAALVQIGLAGEEAARLMLRRTERNSLRLMVSNGELEEVVEELAEKARGLDNGGEPPLVQTEISEQAETPVEELVSEELASENHVPQGDDRPPLFTHRGLLKAVGQADAEFLSNFYYGTDGRLKKVLADIGAQKGGPKALSRLADALRSGEYGSSCGGRATAQGLLHPGLFVRGLAQKWTPQGFPTKPNPTALNKIVDMMPTMKAVADALAALPTKPTNQIDFCNVVWRRLTQEAHEAKVAPAVQVKPVLTLIEGSGGEVPQLAPGEDRLEAHGVTFWPMQRKPLTEHQPTYRNIQQALLFAAQVSWTFAGQGNSGNSVSRELNFYANHIEEMSAVPGALAGAVETIRRFSSAVSRLSNDDLRRRDGMKLGIRVRTAEGK